MFDNRRFIRLLAAATLQLAASLAHAFGEPVTSFQPQSFPGWSCDRDSTLRPDNVFFGEVYVPGAYPYQYSVARFRADGSIDTSWGDHGVANNPSLGGLIYPLGDGGILVRYARFMRYTASGALDAAYGINGQAEYPFESSFVTPWAHAVLRDGTIYMLGLKQATGSNRQDAYVARIDAAGRWDRSFGQDGYAVVTGEDWARVYAFSVMSDGSVEVGSYAGYVDTIRPTLHRYPVDFGAGGTAGASGRILPHTGVASWIDPKLGVDASGNVYFAEGVAGNGFASNTAGVRLLRFAPDGSADGAFDAFIPVTGAVADTFADTAVTSLWHSSDGTWSVLFQTNQYAGGFALINQDGRARVVRFRADGTADPSFTQGVVLAAQMLSVSRATNGDLVSLSSASGRDCGELRLKGDPPAENAMVEYYAPALGHYFMTLEGSEAIGLDTTPAGNGWQRTGLSFGAWMLSDLPGTTKLCRFYGDLQAGPNSHFYTPEGPECDSLKALADKTPAGQSAWRFEGLAGNVAVPRDGACANNLTPVYRLYNKGFEKGGVPNHRYTTDSGVYDEMQGQGWAGEGIAFCVPPPPANPPA